VTGAVLRLGALDEREVPQSLSEAHHAGNAGIHADCHAGQTRSGSWAAKLYEAGEQGVIPRTLCPVLMRDYLGPSLDTTIFATSKLILLFGQNPDQWDIVRDDPSLILNAINECVRLESPIQNFTRRLVADHDVDGARIPKGGRALVMYASANRDERKWDQAERFGVQRKVGEHVGFGHGIHTCAGMHLARMEMQVLLLALGPGHLDPR
jgi:hypothetical protein